LLRLRFFAYWNNNTYGRSRSEAAAMQIQFSLWTSMHSFPINPMGFVMLSCISKAGSTASFAAATASDPAP
jgi:hypothetical protein